MSRDALVVGINSYEYLRPLQSPAKDAEAIAQMLSTYGDFQVWRLPESIKSGSPQVSQTAKVTLRELQQAIAQLFNPKSKQVPDTALLYFSGHGWKEDLGIQSGYLATSDTNPNKGLYGLPLWWLRQILEASPVRQQIIWLDCCYSGGLIDFNSEANPGRGEGRARHFIASSRDFEESYQDLSDPHSTLTKVLLKGLDPVNYPDGWVTGVALNAFLDRALKKDAIVQRPLYTTYGDITLTRSWKKENKTPSDVQQGMICPYKGLSYFDCNDQDPEYFFGRQALIDQLLDQVRRSNFLALVGASGSGKSSVLRAGLLNQLKLGHRLSGSDQWNYRIIVPGEHPLQSLALAFVDPNSDQSPVDRASQLGKAEQLISQGEKGLQLLLRSLPADRVVIAIDQFEEVFTLCKDDLERQQFLQCLMGNLAQDNKLCLILAMRADFFSKCLEQGNRSFTQQLQQHLTSVTQMNREEFTQVIVKPAEQVNLMVEPELVEQILNDVADSPGSLPLLEFTLTKLWERQTDNCLRLKVYTQLGGVEGTLQKRATEVYQNVPEEQAVIRHVFLELTQLGEGTEDTRKRVLKKNLITSQYSEALIDRVVKRLADEKLVVTSEIVAKGVESERFPVVDVAHETLIRHWPELRQWINESRDILRQKREIEEDTEEWYSHGKSQDFLLQGIRLAQAKTFQAEHGNVYPLNVLDEEMIHESIQQEKRDAFQTNCLRVATWTLCAFGLLGFIASLEIYNRKHQTDEAFRELKKVASIDNKIIDLGKRDELLQNLTGGCAGIKNTPWINSYFSTRLFGNCVPFYGKDLSEIDLSKVTLKDANLQKVDLSSAKLCKVRFENVNLQGANLAATSLQESNFINVDFSEANLRGAQLRKATFVSPSNGISESENHRGFESARLRGADLREINLEKTNLQKTDLREVDLRSAKLRNANLGGADLQGADLEGADLEEASLQGATLVKSNLNKTNLSSADLTLANVVDAKLSKAEPYDNIPSNTLDSPSSYLETTMKSKYIETTKESNGVSQEPIIIPSTYKNCL